MDVVVAPYLSAALLLVVAGVAKALDPLPLVKALRAAGLAVRAPVLTRLVRAGAAIEALVGGVAVVDPSRPAAIAVAVSYAGFTAFVLRALRRDSPLASCGCFGRSDTPPTGTHAVVTGLLSLAAAVLALRPEATYGVPLFLVTGVLAYLTYLVLAALPLVSHKATR
jgi:hypothetical protein